jgi:hypothetical protein
MQALLQTISAVTVLDNISIGYNSITVALPAVLQDVVDVVQFMHQY